MGRLVQVALLVGAATGCAVGPELSAARAGRAGGVAPHRPDRGLAAAVL